MILGSLPTRPIFAGGRDEGAAGFDGLARSRRGLFGKFGEILGAQAEFFLWQPWATLMRLNAKRFESAP